MKTVRVKPRKGVELAGIPAAGADVAPELAEEWRAARLVTVQDGPSAARPAGASNQARPAGAGKSGRLQPAGKGS